MYVAARKLAPHMLLGAQARKGGPGRLGGALGQPSPGFQAFVLNASHGLCCMDVYLLAFCVCMRSTRQRAHACGGTSMQHAIARPSASARPPPGQTLEYSFARMQSVAPVMQTGSACTRAPRMLATLHARHLVGEALPGIMFRPSACVTPYNMYVCVKSQPLRRRAPKQQHTRPQAHRSPAICAHRTTHAYCCTAANLPAHHPPPPAVLVIVTRPRWRRSERPSSCGLGHGGPPAPASATMLPANGRCWNCRRSGAATGGAAAAAGQQSGGGAFRRAAGGPSAPAAAGL